METNRTSSFPAALKTIKITTMAVSLSIGMTLLTLALAIGAFREGPGLGAWLLAVIVVLQLVLLSINIVAKHHIDKERKRTAGT